MRNSTNYKLGGPKTFRRSSTKILSRWGGNLQNIEKSMREIYTSDGYDENNKLQVEKLLFWLQSGDTTIFTEEELATIRVLLQVDQAGAEALIVAYDCEPYDYRQLFIHGVKPHIYVALKLFKELWSKKAREHGFSITDDTVSELCDTPIGLLKTNPYWEELRKLIADSDNWPLTERYYYLAKQTVHSFSYDVQYMTFIMNILEKSGGKIVIDKDKGKYFLSTIRSLFPEVVERCRRIERQVEETRMLFNLHGHPFTVTDYSVMSTTMKDLYAWGPQSTVGEITRIAFSRLQEFIESENKKWDILQDNHDSYLSQCSLLEVVECAKKKKEFMNQRLTSPIDGVEFNMKSECQIGFNWAPMKIVKSADGVETMVNPLGLREVKWI